MKERQRWQPEEDAILKAYVNQYGPKEWNLISQRMPVALHRDPKSCLERWKNYLKPGIKNGSLTPDEQSLLISLHSKYGNKWKKIASELPGRTAKRLGKWWEVFKEKQLKLQRHKAAHYRKEYSDTHDGNIPESSSSSAAAAAVVGSSPDKAVRGRYDHILDTFAEKYVQPKLLAFRPGMMPDPDPILSLGSVASSASPATLPLWMNGHTAASSSLSSSTSSTATPSPSVSLSLSPSDPALDPANPDASRFFRSQAHQMNTLIQYCKEVDEGRQNWLQHKKEATWRLSRLEQQIESEKSRKRREKMEETEAKIRCLREEEMGFHGRIESEYREQLNVLQRDAESKEAKLVEAWSSQHVKLAKFVEQVGFHTGHGVNVPKDMH